jgi:hypothetical protein
MSEEVTLDALVAAINEESTKRGGAETSIEHLKEVVERNKIPLSKEILAKFKEEMTKQDKAPQTFWMALEVIARFYENRKLESAALAVRAALEFVERMHFGKHLHAPLLEAVDIIERGVDPERRAIYARVVKIIETMEPHTTASADLRWITKETVDKILASVAVELQLRCGVKLNDALKRVAGRDAGAVKKLKDFRYNMTRLDSPRGAREMYFKLIHSSLDGSSPSDAADRVLKYCHSMQGKKS